MNPSDDLFDEILSRGASSETWGIIISRLKEAGHGKRAIQECLKALQTYPKDLDLRCLLAETLWESGLISQAERELEEVMMQITRLSNSFKLLATLYHRQKRNEEARRVLKIYLAHRPEDAQAIHLLEELESLEKKGDEGQEEVHPAQEMEELPDISTPTLAEIYFQQGRIQDALTIYEKVLVHHPEDRQSIKRIAEIRAAMISDGTAEKEKNRDRAYKEKCMAVLDAWRRETRVLFKEAVAMKN